MSASQSMLAGAVSITVEDVTVDEAMGLVTLGLCEVDNGFVAGDESLSDLSLMQATAAVEATNVVAGDVSVKDSALIIFSGTSIDLAAVQQVTVMTDPASNENLTIYPALALPT